jgi:Ca2+-binding RTX toxin-like protein
MSRSQWLTRVGVTLFTTIAVGAISAPALAASAGKAGVSGTAKVVVKAGSGNANNIVITRSGRTVTIDDRVALQPGKGCKQVKGDKTRVTCTTSKNPTLVHVTLGDKDDVFTNKTSIPSAVYGGDGNDKIYGGTGTDRLYGDRGNDRVTGGTGNDTIYGGDGTDSLDGGHGHDKIDAGSGNDKVWGQVGDDKIWGQAGHDQIWAGDGNDTVDGSYGDDKIYGGAGNDTLSGWDGSDRVAGESGTDTIRGGLGADSLDGGTGNDAIYGYQGAVTTWGQDSGDKIWGQAGDDRLYGEDGNDSLYGGAGNDTLYGGAGNDTLTGEAGNDKEYGGAGDDKFVQALKSSTDADVFVGDAGTDTVSYSGRAASLKLSNDDVTGNDGADGERDTISTGVETLIGGSWKDVITGGPGPELLIGSDGNDTINGGGGDDRIYGGGVNGVPDDSPDPFDNVYPVNHLVGGAGNDQIIGSMGDDRLFGDYNTPSDTPRPVGADRIFGGGGIEDLVSYEYADGPVTVTAAAQTTTGNGQQGEGDQITGVTSVIGSEYDDVLTGGYDHPAFDGEVQGLGGDDVLTAGGPRSVLEGGAGADELHGGGELWGNTYRQDDSVRDQLFDGIDCHVYALDVATGCNQVLQH